MTEISQQKIQILVVDSCEIIRIGLRALIADDPLLNIVAEAACLDDAINLAASLQPDVILLDTLLSDNYGNHIPALKTSAPKTRILVFPWNKDEVIHLKAFTSLASGVIAKHQSAELLIKAIYAVHAGHLWFDRQLTELLWQTRIDHQTATDESAKTTNPSMLSPRELEVALLASQGFSAKKISKQLAISEKTVRNKLTLIYEKLGVVGKIELCMNANKLESLKVN
jgi:DNA-binding NarL/FixJ family response regulator